MGVIFDLDQTLIDSSIAESHRNNRKWAEVYKLIPNFSIYSGIMESLKYLQTNSIPFCIVTSSPSIYCEKVAAHYNIPCLNKVCFHDTTKRKPHPEPILKALNLMNVDASTCLSLGDKDSDIHAARAANVNSVACLWGASDKNSLLQLNPNYVVNTPDDLLPLFKRFFIE